MAHSEETKRKIGLGNKGNLMTLKKWWEAYKEYGGTLALFHKGSGILPSHMSEYLSGKRPIGLKVANRIIQETNGLVGYKELMPELYKKIVQEERWGD